MVTDIGSIGKGKIREGTGSAVFHVQYTCLVFRPFKGEVLDAVVSSVNKVEQTGSVTLCDISLVGKCQAEALFALQMGFFAEAGPLQIFVSQHLIPSHYRVEITDDAAFESEENAPPIKAGASVRVRLMGLKAEANQLVSHRHSLQHCLQHSLQPCQEDHAFGCNVFPVFADACSASVGLQSLVDMFVAVFWWQLHVGKA